MSVRFSNLTSGPVRPERLVRRGSPGTRRVAAACRTVGLPSGTGDLRSAQWQGQETLPQGTRNFVDPWYYLGKKVNHTSPKRCE